MLYQCDRSIVDHNDPILPDFTNGGAIVNNSVLNEGCFQQHQGYTISQKVPGLPSLVPFSFVNQHQSCSSRNRTVDNRSQVYPGIQAAGRVPVRGESEISACIRDIDHNKGEHNGVGGNPQPEDNWWNVHLVLLRPFWKRLTTGEGITGDQKSFHRRTPTLTA